MNEYFLIDILHIAFVHEFQKNSFLVHVYRISEKNLKKTKDYKKMVVT